MTDRTYDTTYGDYYTTPATSAYDTATTGYDAATTGYDAATTGYDTTGYGTATGPETTYGSTNYTYDTGYGGTTYDTGYGGTTYDNTGYGGTTYDPTAGTYDQRFGYRANDGSTYDPTTGAYDQRYVYRVPDGNVHHRERLSPAGTYRERDINLRDDGTTRVHREYDNPNTGTSYQRDYER